jgi:acyl carrier protein
MPSDAEILELFKEALLEVDNRRRDRVELTMELSELGLDSVQIMEVLGAMEEKLHIQFPDEDLAGVRRIGDLTALVRRLM